MADKEGPNRPEPKQVNLESKTTAVLVLDLNARCQDPKEVCSKLMQPLGEFLERVRGSSLPIIYTISLMFKGTALGEVAIPLKRRETEPIIHPDAFDKFVGGELRDILNQRSVKNLIIVGSLTNVAVLYTSTSAARIYRYNVIIPLDGVNAKSIYEHEYALHQLTVLPAGASERFRFTTLSMIHFH
ncbi:MAG: cysteine hydrolase family protein [Candidatus Binatia bacterium]